MAEILISKNRINNNDQYLYFLGRLIEKICLTIIKWGTYLILFTPLIISGKFFFPFVGPKSLYFFGLVEIIFFSYLILILSSPKYRPRLNILLISIILFVFLSIISSASGVDFFNSFWSKYERMTGLLMWFHLLAFFLVISSVFKKKDWTKIFEVSAMVAILVGIVSLLPRIGIEPLEKSGLGTRGGATLGNSSFLATYLLFNAFISLYLFSTALSKKDWIDQIGGWLSFLGRRITIIFYGLNFAFITFSLFLSTGRAAIISFFIGMLLLFFLKVIFYEKGILRLIAIFLLIIILLSTIGIIFFAVQPQENIVQKFLTDKFSLEATQRTLVWEVGFKGWQEKPWLGWGLENFDRAYFKHFSPEIFLPGHGDDLWYDRAHNIVVDLLVSNGIIGFLSYLGIFAAVFYILWKKYLSQRIEFLSAGIISVLLIAYFLQNLTVFDMVSSLMMFFIILGFVGSITREKEEVLEKKVSVPNSFIILIIIIIFIVSFFNFFIQPFRTDYYIVKALQTQDTAERISFDKKSLAISSLGKYQVREAFDNYVMQLFQKEIADKVPENDQRMELDFVSGELEKNVKESPSEYTSYFLLGRIYTIYSRLDASKISLAKKNFEKAIELSPGNPQNYWALAQTKMIEGDFNGAFSLFRKAIEIEPKSEKSYLIAIQAGKITETLTKDDSFVKEMVNEALKVDSSWYNDIQAVMSQK